MNLHLIRTFFLGLSWAAFSLATSAIAKNQPVDGNLSVTGDTDLGGNTLSFGSLASDNNVAGFIVNFTDSTLPQITIGASQIAATWLWRSANGPQLRVDSGNVLGLFAPGRGSPAITLNPAGTSVFTNGLTVSGQSVVTTNQLSSYATSAQVTTALVPYLLSSGSAASLVDLNASALASGTIPDARLSSNVTLLGSIIALADETTGNLAWTRVDKTGSSLVNLTTRNFSDLQSIPTSVDGYGITDAVKKSSSGNVEVTGISTLQGDVTINGTVIVNGLVTKLRVAQQGDLDMGGFTNEPSANP